MPTGTEAYRLQLCPPKGEMHEPIWFVRAFIDPKGPFLPGPPVIDGSFVPQPGPEVNIIMETWEDV